MWLPAKLLCFWVQSTTLWTFIFMVQRAVITERSMPTSGSFSVSCFLEDIIFVSGVQMTLWLMCLGCVNERACSFIFSQLKLIIWLLSYKSCTLSAAGKEPLANEQQAEEATGSTHRSLLNCKYTVATEYNKITIPWTKCTVATWLHRSCTVNVQRMLHLTTVHTFRALSQISFKFEIHMY